jgi:hypothetical protein
MAFNIQGLTDGIHQVYKERPELFGAETTGPIDQEAARKRMLDANFDRRFGPGGPTPLQRGRHGGVFNANNDLQELEVFGINEQQDAMTGRSQEGILRGLANRAGAETNAAEARARRARKVAVDEGTFERQTRGRGLSERQQKAAKRSLGLNRALAIADAGSASRRRTTDLAIGARKAGVALEQGAFGQELAGLTALANAEGQKRIREAQQKAQKKSRKRGLLGAIVGGALSFIPGIGPIIGPMAGAAISNG